MTEYWQPSRFPQWWRDMPRGWWQAPMWYVSALLMTLAHHGFHHGKASSVVAAWFAGVCALYALTYTFGAWEQQHRE